jgi:hypothetical protein
MQSAGIKDPAVINYGDLKSRNTFNGETIGLVLGRIDLGVDNVVAMSEQLGLDVETVPDWSAEMDARFTGPDSDAAIELVNSVRVARVQQAVGRYAREARNPDDHATVYVWSNVLPSSWVDERVGGVTGHVGKKARQAEKVIQDSDAPITRKTVEEESGVARGTAHSTLKRMFKNGLVTRTRGGGPVPDEYHYVDGALEPAVDLGPE